MPDVRSGMTGNEGDRNLILDPSSFECENLGEPPGMILIMDRVEYPLSFILSHAGARKPPRMIRNGGGRNLMLDSRVCGQMMTGEGCGIAVRLSALRSTDKTGFRRSALCVQLKEFETPRFFNPHQSPFFKVGGAPPPRFWVSGFPRLRMMMKSLALYCCLISTGTG